ncbi:MAG TPA: arsenate reductase ArsC [Ktedonobacterales bacterium]|jgi:arsenate reductase|nr:arsenate reductase ArsC [Ktedonobacterales bacterium]
MRHATTPANQLTPQPEQSAESNIAKRVLFLCTHNSSRSQIAEGFLNARGGDRYAAFSAGTRPGGINPLAVRVMAEIGIDISEAAGHFSKGLDAYAGQPFDLVVTVCDSAAEECPFFPGARRQTHWGFPDPAAVTGSDDERLATFRQARDAIGARIDAFLAENSAS